jgi:hypothetical protein
MRLSIPVESELGNNETQILSDELIHFDLINILEEVHWHWTVSTAAVLLALSVPGKAGLPFPATLLCFSALPLMSIHCHQHRVWILPLPLSCTATCPACDGLKWPADRAFLAK